MASIAHVGDFSVSNYGDQIYPGVVGSLLRRAGVNAPVEHYALLPGRTPAGEVVRPLLEVAQRRHSLVVVGGGDLIRADGRTVALDHLRLGGGARTSGLSRLRARRFRRRHFPAGPGPWLPAAGWGESTPVLLASVGVHALPRTDDVDAAVGHVTAAYVRTEPGRAHLLTAGVPAARLVVGPDAVFALEEFHDLDRLHARGRQVLRTRTGLRGPVVVVHAAAFHGWSSQRVAQVLGELAGLDVCTLALGRYAGEHRMLVAAARAVGVPHLQDLPADEVTAVLGGAAAVITTSMHAAIVAGSAATPLVVPGVGKTAAALAACPDPPPVHDLPESGLRGLIEDLVGRREPAPSPRNRLAAERAFTQSLGLVGMQ